MTRFSTKTLAGLAFAGLLGTMGAATPRLAAESCQQQSELAPADKAALQQTAQRFSQTVIAGNWQALQAEAIPSLSADFTGVSFAVAELAPKIAGAHSTTDFLYLLDATDAKAALPQAQFFCGLFNAPIHVTFSIPNLPPGKYAFAISEIDGGKVPYKLSYVLQNQGGSWKLAGFFPKPREAAGHDGLYYWKQARTAKTQGQLHNSYFDYMTATDLLSPVPFASSPNMEKLISEQQAVQPDDIPVDKPVALTISGKVYQFTQMFPVSTEKGMALVVKYSVPNVSDTAAAFQDNMAVIKGLVEKYPEYRTNFAEIVARATAPAGQDYGTELAIKDIK